MQELRDLMDRLAPDGEPEAFYVTGSPPDARPDRCLVLDAAFNPPTRAHLALAHHGAEASNADRVLLQVSATNVDKGISGADLGQRLYMVSRLAGRLASIDVSACSHARFVDKASALQKLSPNTRYVFAIGYDTLIRLFDEKYYDSMIQELDDLFSRAEFAVANRGENDTESLIAYLNRAPQDRYADRIHPVSLSSDYTGISSSGIRDRIRRGEDVSEQVPGRVLDLVHEMGLYRE